MSEPKTYHETEADTISTAMKCVAVVLICIVASIAGCVSNTNYQKRVLATTQDPVAVACLFESQNDGVCAISRLKD